MKESIPINTSGRELDEEARVAAAAQSNLFNAEKIIIHQQYEPRSHLHDIAVIRLDRIVQFSPVIQRICLPPPSLPSLEERTAFVAGYINQIHSFGEILSRL